MARQPQQLHPVQATAPAEELTPHAQGEAVVRRNSMAQVAAAAPAPAMPPLQLLKVTLVVSAVRLGPGGLREITTQPLTVQGADWPSFTIEALLANMEQASVTGMGNGQA